MKRNPFIMEGTTAKECENINQTLSTLCREMASSLSPQERALLARALRRLSRNLQIDAYLAGYSEQADLGVN